MLFFLLGVGFEPTQLSLEDLKSSPLDHSGILAGNNFKNSKTFCFQKAF